MKFLIVFALIALSTVNAVPKAQNSPSGQQQQQLSMQIEQRLRDAGFDVSKLPHDSNGNLDLSKLPRDSNGNIELNQVVNGGSGSSGGGGSNGGGSINGGGNGGVSFGGGSSGFDPSNLSDQQKHQLSITLEQRLQQSGFDVNQLPRDSNGDIDFSKLPRDSNGNIELSQIINRGSGSSGGQNQGPPSGPGNRRPTNRPGRGSPPNGGGSISFNINTLPSSGTININQIPNVQDGNLNLSPLNIGLQGTINLKQIENPNGDIPVLQLKLLLLRKIINKLPDSGTINVNQIPAINGNGQLDLRKLGIGLSGTIDLSSIIGPIGDIPIPQLKQLILNQIVNLYPSVNGDGGTNVNGGGGASVNGGGGGNAEGCNYETLKNGGVNIGGGANGDIGANFGSEGRSGPNGEVGPNQLKPSETGGKYDEFAKQFGSKDGKLGVTDIGEIVCDDHGLQKTLGHVINGTQITLNCITDTARNLLQKILDKKGLKGANKNIFGRAASQADNTLQVFIEGLGRGGRIFFCGIYSTVIKILQALKSGHPIGGLVKALQYFTGGAEQFFAAIPQGIGETLRQAEHGVGRILNLKGGI